METFTWKPSRRPSRTLRPRVHVTPFGDGYKQRFADGLNALLPTWSLVFGGRSRAEADAIDAFLSARGGAEAFAWTDPLGVSGAWICSEWRRDDLGRGFYAIAATFEKVPA